MMSAHRASITIAIVVALALPAHAQGGRGQRGGRGGAVARDIARGAPAGTGVIAGRVLAADTGRPVKRARVVLGNGGGQPRATTTDEQGRYRISGLPAGTYRLSASKTGFVDGAFGQRRAFRDGTAIELADNQQVADADVKLARGGVITGHVFDEDGEPLARAIVTVLRSQYARGEKQLAAVGTPDQTDDRGQFRVYGLPPGDYAVSATAGGLERAIAQITQFGAPGAGEQSSDRSGYAPTYYPGVTSAADAGRLRLATAQELGGVDFSIQLVPFATVRGVVTGGSGTVMLLPEGALSAGGGGRGGRGGAAGMAGVISGVLLGGQTLRTQTQPDGSFTMPNVIPGRYTIVANVDMGGASKMAIQPLVVAGEEVTVTLAPASGVDVGGTITLEAGTLAVPASLTGFRVALTPLESAGLRSFGLRPAEPQPNGRFTIGGVFPGPYAVRATAPRGWMMKSVYLDGRDVTDEPVEIKADAVAGLNVIFTDRIASLSGAVHDRSNAPVEGLTIIVFPQDERRWQPQSRQIVTARSDKAGAYRVSMLPPGEYYVVAVDDVEPGEWFDPSFLEQVRETAVKLTIADGEQRTADLKAPSGS